MIFYSMGENPSPGVLIGIYAAKLALLALCFGSGLPGGIFFPLLVLGSLVGNVFGQAAASAGLMEPQYVSSLALMAMTGHFSAIVRSPLTGILLISEMTGSFAFMLPLGLVAMTAYVVAEGFRSEPIYESLQKGLLSSSSAVPTSGHEAARSASPRDRMLVEFGVENLSPADGRTIAEILWPEDSLVIAVKRGSGEGADAVSYEEIMYEAYGPAGVAILIECLTDNRNRAVADVRTAVTRNGATMADGGSVQRLFNRKGIVTVPRTFEVEEGRRSVERTVDEDQLLEATIDAAVEDLRDQGDVFELVCDPNDLVEVRKAVQAAGLDYDSAEVSFVASFNQTVDDVDEATKLERIIDAVEDLDDVQNVYSNAEYSPQVEEALAEQE